MSHLWKLEDGVKKKHERKHDLYDYFRKIESISIESRKGLAELIYGNHSFTVFRVPRLQRGKLFSLRGKWILMCGYGASRGGRYLKVFKLRSKPHTQLFERMAKLRDYCQRVEYYEEMEDYYKELKVERLRKKNQLDQGYIFSPLLVNIHQSRRLVKNVISKLLFQVIGPTEQRQGAIMSTSTNVKVAVNYPTLKKIKRNSRCLY